MPAEIGPDEFRRVLGQLPTGVTVLTAFAGGSPVGMAANSVTSVSLDPPLLLACPARTSETWPLLREAGRFCVNVLGASHGELARRFSRRGIDRFDGVEWTPRNAGPALPDAVAWIECALRSEHDAGDHTIALADVLALEAGEGEPLVFSRGRYGTFSG